MKIEIDKLPNIRQIVFRAEPSDKFYSNCMWGVVNLDLKNGIMSACTDCGNYAYRWPEKGKEFLELMRTVDVGYLLSKISSLEFDYERTVLEVLDYFDKYDNENCSKAVSFFEAINEKFVTRKFDFYDVIDEYDDEGLFADLDIDSFICYDYPIRAITFARLFVEYIQPYLTLD